MRIFWLGILLILAGMLNVSAFEPASEETVNFIQKQLIPLPVQVQWGAGTVSLNESLTVTITAPNPDEAQNIFQMLFLQWFQKKPKVETAVYEPNEENKIPADGYKMEAEGNRLHITVSDAGGLRNALKTLRQLTEPNRDAALLSCYFVPEMKISDYPALAFRGIHLCWFPETDPMRIEQGIRMAGYYKFNYVVLEMWGTYRFESHPDFCWSEKSVKKEDIRRLVEIGRSLGVTLIPQFNLFGHASAARSCSGKHTILDFHPEYQPLFEPDGWTWCLSNPATRTILTDLVLDLYDAFDKPPYFHLGCDEADSARTCRLCRHSDYGKLLLDHLTYFYNLLEERGSRAMMWHDMLIQPEERFAGYYTNGKSWTASIIDALPKGMIICDWEYEKPKENETWPTNDYFAEKGFDVAVCPWNVPSGIVSLGEKAVKAHYFGFLQTTWHHFSDNSMRQMLADGAYAAWGTAYSGFKPLDIDRHIRQIGWDCDNMHYEQTGLHPCQVAPRDKR